MSALLCNPFVTIAADTGTSYGRTTCSIGVLSSGNATSWSLVVVENLEAETFRVLFNNVIVEPLIPVILCVQQLL